jgi:hypothetical protein
LSPGSQGKFSTRKHEDTKPVTHSVPLKKYAGTLKCCQLAKMFFARASKVSKMWSQKFATSTADELPTCTVACQEAAATMDLKTPTVTFTREDE